jgi:sugar lactone lactonase YvrE
VAGTGVDGYSGDGGPAASAALNRPTDVKADASGSIFITDSRNHAVRLVRSYDGKIRTLAGVYPGTNGFNGDNQPAVTARMDTPGGITLAGVRGSGIIYIADTANNRIRVLTLKKVKELY